MYSQGDASLRPIPTADEVLHRKIQSAPQAARHQSDGKPARGMPKLVILVAMPADMARGSGPTS